MPNYPYTFQLPPLNVQDIPNDGVAGEFLGINGSGQLDWLTAGGGGTGDMLKSENLSGLASYPTARTNLGLGTGDSPTFANLTLTSPSLSSSAPVTISQTWNNAAVAFTGLKVNAVSTNSAAGSLLADFQLGGVSKSKVDKGGFITAAGVFVNVVGKAISNPAGQELGFGYTNNGCAFYRYSTTIASFVNSASVGGNSSGLNLGTDALGFASSAEGALSVVILRDGADNTLALRNGGAAQTFNIYNTYQNAGVDYERIAFKWSANLFTIGREFGGTGAARSINIVGGGSVLGIGSAANAAVDWTFSNGTLLAGTDNSRDIGASGANRPRNLYVGSNIYAAGNVGIGTTAPTSGLHISGALGGNTTTYDSAAALKLTNATVNSSWLLTSGIIGVSNSHFSIRRDSVALPALTIAGITDNVGIGTTSPTSKLHVAETWNNAGTAFCAIKSVITDTNSAAGSDFLELYSGTSTQPLRMDINKTGQINIYGTWTDASNYERLSFSAPTAGNAIIGTNKSGGSSVARGLELQTNGVTRITILGGGDTVVSSSFTAAGIINTGNRTLWSGKSALSSPADGLLLVTNNGATDFNRIQLGGTADTFPALKRSTTRIQAVLATTDTTFTNIQGKLTTDTDYTATVVTPTGFLTLYDAQGTAYRVPCVLAP